MTSELGNIREWRGVKNLVAARVLTDNNGDGGYTTDTVYSIAGVASITRTTDSSEEPHYYDDMPAVLISGIGTDTVTIDTSAISLDVLAWLTGQVYKSNLGAMIEGKPKPPYFALGYITERDDGSKVCVWRYKGKFAVPDQSNSTKDNTANAEGNQLIYTGISTTHKFVKYGKGAKAMSVDDGLHLSNVWNFFDHVTTPDELEASTAVVGLAIAGIALVGNETPI